MEAGEWNDYCNPGSTSFLTIPDPDDEKHRYAILGEIPPPPPRRHQVSFTLLCLFIKLKVSGNLFLRWKERGILSVELRARWPINCQLGTKPGCFSEIPTELVWRLGGKFQSKEYRSVPCRQSLHSKF